MKNRIQISKAKANYLVFGGIFLIISTAYVLISEPNRFNIVAGFVAIILFGIGTFLGIDKLIGLKTAEIKSIDAGQVVKKTAFKTVVTSFVKATVIMIAVLLFVYFKNGNIDLKPSSWLLIFVVYTVLASLSAYVRVRDSHLYHY